MRAQVRAMTIAQRAVLRIWVRTRAWPSAMASHSMKRKKRAKAVMHAAAMTTGFIPVDLLDGYPCRSGEG
jgi:hypothetical protein